ncbi:MAG: hypothetical protein H0V12_01620 [Chloroflexi bacterium]|nr:hypothetical protein [Chloroflexota bacterium]
MSEAPKRSPRLPPRFVVVSAWVIHRAIHRLTGGRKGLWRPKPNRWGTMRLTTVGRRSGKDRSAILGYYEDGPNLVTMAMNGWAVSVDVDQHRAPVARQSGRQRSICGKPWMPSVWESSPQWYASCVKSRWRIDERECTWR